MVDVKIDKSKIPANAIKVCKMLQDAGHEAYLVGGCVRDLLMGETPKDFDITTDATPEQSMEIFSSAEGEKYPKCYPTGIDHGTITVALGPIPSEDHFEVTVFRAEGKYLDGRRPEEVAFVKDLNKDLERRDLTINAIAYDPIENKIADPFGGVEDLKNKNIKAVGIANDRFSEDGLRTMRAARFAAKYDFNIDPETRKAIENNLPTLGKVSKERLQDELIKTLKTKDPRKGLKILNETGCLQVLGLSKIQNPRIEQNIEVINQCGNDKHAQLALLLYGMPSLSDAESKLRSLKFSNDDIKNTLFLLESVNNFVNHIKNNIHDTDAVKKFIAWFKNKGTKFETDIVNFMQICRALGFSEAEILLDINNREKIISKKEFNDLINGQDLKAMGVPPGKEMGDMLNDLYQKVVSGELKGERPVLLDKAEQIYKSKKKQARLKRRKMMLKLASNFWDLSDDDQKEWQKKKYDFGNGKIYEAGELPHIQKMIHVPAGPELHHPEKNQAIHNWMVYEQARRLSDDPRDWYAAALHDLGKVYTDKEKWPKQHGHESGGVPHVKSLSRELGVPEDWEDIAKLVAEHHLKGHTAKELKPSTLKNFFDSLKNKRNFDSFLTAIEADQRGRLGKEEESHPHKEYLRDEYQKYLNPPAKPNKIDLAINISDYVQPGQQYGKIKKFLEGVVKDQPLLNNEVSLRELILAELAKG